MPESQPPIRWRVMPASLAAALAADSLLPDTSSAATFEFADGEGSLTFDSTFSMGLLARTQRSDRRLVGIANGGTSHSVNEDDGRGQLWRVGEQHTLQFYDLPGIGPGIEVHHDLQSGRYLAMGITNEESKVYQRVKRSAADFSPSGLRGAGTR